MESSRLEYIPYTALNTATIYSLLESKANNVYTCFPKRNDKHLTTKLSTYYTKPNQKSFLLSLPNSSQIIGFVSFNSICLEHLFASITCIIIPEQQNKGFAKEALSYLIKYAFNTLGLFRLEAQVYVENRPSILLFESLCFTQEARLRKNFMINGVLQDSYLYSLLKSDSKCE